MADKMIAGRIATIKGFIEVDERKLERLKREHHMLGLGIENVEESLVKDRQKVEELEKMQEQK